MQRIDGPYGGGKRFADTLETYFLERGHGVFRDLAKDLDVILIVSSKKDPATTSYPIGDIKNYVDRHPDTIIVHRVNTCDEPRGLDLGNNRAILAANHLADHTVFVSTFVKELFWEYGLPRDRPNCVIHNGADERIFNPHGSIEWQSGEKLKLVTHHWSPNYLKGFDVYERLDQLLHISPFNDLFEFTCIGNTPLGLSFKNTRLLPPLNEMELAHALKHHHVYITAARHEPGGNHYIEGMRCGLPVLYLRSGSLPEYCGSYGLPFSLVDFEEKLLEMPQNYAELRQRTLECPYTGIAMASRYEKLFERLVEEGPRHPRPTFHWKNRLLPRAFLHIGRFLSGLRARPRC